MWMHINVVLKRDATFDLLQHSWVDVEGAVSTLLFSAICNLILDKERVRYKRATCLALCSTLAFKNNELPFSNVASLVHAVPRGRIFSCGSLHVVHASNLLHHFILILADADLTSFSHHITFFY